jgi:predicted  nucleic acid-binding Zn-ribbon protein
MNWEDILKQKPLNMNMMEVAAGFEYGDESAQNFKSQIERLIPKMPEDIKAGYIRAMEWVKSQM